MVVFRHKGLPCGREENLTAYYLLEVKGRRTSYPNPSLGDIEYLLNVHLVSKVRRSCEVKQTESASSTVISTKCGDSRRS